MLKLALLAITAWSAHTTFTSPHPTPTTAPPQPYLPLIIAPLLKTLFTALLLTECIFILFPSFSLHNLPLPTPNLNVTPLSILGTLLSLLGALLRKKCYTTLGRHFTFAISIQPKHTLITTGPYAIIRHPSYTAVTLAYIGILLVLSDSWGPAEWGYERVVTWTLVWGLTGIVGMLVMFPRIKSEDTLLHEHFGAEWERWRERVPYSLVPYIY
ncbi:hypothetical protein BDQ17DRAFT_1364003 [Cyathus striatus]|nr:hypothetical protein BDQ17DRAFT_1364003 [Cyathus striatus]